MVRGALDTGSREAIKENMIDHGFSEYDNIRIPDMNTLLILGVAHQGKLLRCLEFQFDTFSWAQVSLEYTCISMPTREWNTHKNTDIWQGETDRGCVYRYQTVDERARAGIDLNVVYVPTQEMRSCIAIYLPEPGHADVSREFCALLQRAVGDALTKLDACEISLLRVESERLLIVVATNTADDEMTVDSILVALGHAALPAARAGTVFTQRERLRPFMLSTGATVSLACSLVGNQSVCWGPVVRNGKWELGPRDRGDLAGVPHPVMGVEYVEPEVIFARAPS